MTLMFDPRPATKLRIAALMCLAISVAGVASSQGLRAGPRGPAIGALPPADEQTETRQADYIVAVVNTEPITNREVAREMLRLQQMLIQQRQPMPSAAELGKVVLDRLINERAQLQLARDTGIRVDDPSVDQAELTVARQNNISLAELRTRVTLDGIDVKRFREQLRDQIMLNRLRDREMASSARVSEVEVQQYFQDQLALARDPANVQLNLAQIFIAVPESASSEVLDQLTLKAKSILERARSGQDFFKLAREVSDAADRNNGGEMGARMADRYPALFWEAVKNLKSGELSGVVRSGAGFHVLKVLDARVAGLPPTTVTQHHARHILLVPGAALTEAAARDTLLDFRRRIEAGQASFASLAKDNSQDSSAARGGDLGWANPGQFVPEFEAVINSLALGQISDPLITRFGVHLIQLLAKRQSQLDVKDQKEMVRNMLREKKLEEGFANWAKDVRDRAYVELRDPPL
jgi:peptidyl-prolyl cis-trans isomerase SurA